MVECGRGAGDHQLPSMHQQPQGGRVQHRQDSTEQRIAPWVPMDAAWWPDAIDAITKPWPWGMVMLDLRWLDDRVRMGRARRIPGRPALRARWGWTDHRVRVALRSDEWASPTRIASESPADRQPVASPSPAAYKANAANQAEIASPSPADRQPVASESPHALETDVRRQTTERTTTTANPESKPPPPRTPPSDEGSPLGLLTLDLSPPREQAEDPKADTAFGWAKKLAKAAARTTTGPGPTALHVQQDTLRLVGMIHTRVVPKSQGTVAGQIGSLMRASGMDWTETVNGLTSVLGAAQACQAQRWVWLRENGYSANLATLTRQKSWSDHLELALAHTEGRCACPRRSPEGLTPRQLEERRQRQEAAELRSRPKPSPEAIEQLRATARRRRTR